ncbi:MAG: hypothetical protein V2A78_09215 [bacterium]
MTQRPIFQYLLFCGDISPKTPQSTLPITYHDVVCKYIIGANLTKANFYVVLGFHNWVGKHECFLKAWFKKSPQRVLVTERMPIEGTDPYLVQVIAFPIENFLVTGPDVLEVQFVLDGKPEKNTFPLSFVRLAGSG